MDSTRKLLAPRYDHDMLRHWSNAISLPPLPRGIVLPLSWSANTRNHRGRQHRGHCVNFWFETVGTIVLLIINLYFQRISTISFNLQLYIDWIDLIKRNFPLSPLRRRSAFNSAMSPSITILHCAVIFKITFYNCLLEFPSKRSHVPCFLYGTVDKEKGWVAIV